MVEWQTYVCRHLQLNMTWTSIYATQMKVILTKKSLSFM